MAKAKEATKEKAAKSCPVTKEQFLSKAKPIVLNMAEVNVTALMSPREMNTGSLGFHTNGSCIVTVDGVPVEATWQAQVILKHSKPAG